MLTELEFITSSFCHEGGCVEVAKTPDGTRYVRRTSGGAVPISFTRDEWEAFVKGVKNDEFD